MKQIGRKNKVPAGTQPRISFAAFVLSKQPFVLSLIDSVLCEFLCFLWCSNIYRVWWFMVQASAEGKELLQPAGEQSDSDFPAHLWPSRHSKNQPEPRGSETMLTFSPDQSRGIIINHTSNLINSNFLCSLLWNWKDRTKDRRRTFSQALGRNSHIDVAMLLWAAAGI